MCLFHVRKIWQLPKQVRHTHGEGRMSLWLERNWLCTLWFSSRSLDRKHQAILQWLFVSSVLPKHPVWVTAPEQCSWKVIEAPDPVTHQPCLEPPISRQELANCTNVGMAEFFILVSSCWPCYKRAGTDLKLECFASKSTSHSSQGCQQPSLCLSFPPVTPG